MFVDDVSTRQSLVRMVRRLTSNGALRDDLLQEALIHLWLTEGARPAQTRSWYLQSCKFHLLHYLGAGRSVDSAKRRLGQLRLEEEDTDHQELVADEDTGDSIFEWVSARDIINLLWPHLKPQEQAVLSGFAEGLRLREIGRKLNVSHTMVVRHRRKIAALLNRLEKTRPLSNGKKIGTNGHKSHDDYVTPTNGHAMQLNGSQTITRICNGAFFPPRQDEVATVVESVSPTVASV